MFESIYNIIFSDAALPVVFVILMGIAIFAYVILDGYDLGVGMLIPLVDDEEKDIMISSIGPFWDANETWLVLSVGILLIAFPMAQGIILTSLYIPVAIMLIGLILRGVSFDFRVKVHAKHKHIWNKLFFIGSLVTALAQGYMLGQYIEKFQTTIESLFFSAMCAIGVAASYCLIGSSWIIMRCEGDLQKKAIAWARIALKFTAFGILLVSSLTPFISQRIYDKWFSFPSYLYLFPIPLIAIISIFYLDKFLGKMPFKDDKHNYIPFLGSIFIYLSGFIGLAYSFYPYIIPDYMTIWEAASAPESLRVILIGALIVVPIIIIYTFFVYRIFWGKVTKLSY